MKVLILPIKEHENLPTLLSNLGIEIPKEAWLPRKVEGKPVFLFDIDQEGKLGYYIGLDWLTKEHALECTPKIPELDYMVMFHACLKDKRAFSRLGSIYHIETESPWIPSRRPHDELNTIISLHFLAVLNDLIKRPLKKDYIRRNENLTARIKGKIDLQNHFKENILGQRPDRVFCTYQEYTTDCYDNRLLHSAFSLALGYLGKQKLKLPKHLAGIQQSFSQAFVGISKIESISDLHKVKANPLYREYGEAVRLAKLIYRILGYRHQKDTSMPFQIPPYTIDMSLLFELYVYQLLPSDGILYQQSVNYGQPDFLDTSHKRILDAKYKAWYVNASAGDMIEDVRQMAGYARDTGTHAIFGLKNPALPLPCVIIFPKNDGCDSLEKYWDYCEPLKPFQEFYKVGINYPKKPPVLVDEGLQP